jgi:hypothetical protein
MTNTKIKKITKNTTPNNIARHNGKKISDFKNLLNLANATDKELKELSITKGKVCDNIVNYYIGLNIGEFENKFKTDAIENDIAIRLKGFKPSPIAKPIIGTAKTVISNCKKFIKLGNVIDKTTTYKAIRKATASKPTLTENRINLNKKLALLSDDIIAKLLETLK